MPDFYINNIFVIFCIVIKTRALMNNDEELKARIEELEQDLIFYLRKYHELTPRGKWMKAVLDKEIKSIEEEIKRLSQLL